MAYIAQQQFSASQRPFCATYVACWRVPDLDGMAGHALELGCR